MSPRFCAWAAVAVILAGCGSSAPLGRREVALREAGLAEAAMRRGHPIAAARRYDAAIAEARAVDDRPLVTRFLVDQAAALARGGRCDLAGPRAKEAREAAEGVLAARAALVLATCARDVDDAKAELTRARAAAAKDPCLLATIDCSEGAKLAETSPSEAAERYRRAAARGCTSADVVALCAYNEGRLAARGGRHLEAAGSFSRSSRAAAQAGDTDGVAVALLSEARARAAAGQSAEAGRLARRAGHAAWSAARYARAAQAFAFAAEQFDASGDRESAQACRENGRRALQRVEASEPSASQ